MEVRIEVSNSICPRRLPLGDGVELFLHTSGEVVVHDAGELLHEEVIDDDPDIRGEELATLCSVDLLACLLGDLPILEGEHGIATGLTFAVGTLDVATILDRLYRGGIGRRTADAELLHLTDHRSFRIACGALGEALIALKCRECQPFPFLDGG